MQDFTLTIYRQLLLALWDAGYSFYTFEEWCDGKAQGRYVILRHDVDKAPQNALEFAMLESEMGIKSTFYFRTVEKVIKPLIINEINSLGHEIGYHYRDLVDAKGNYNKAIVLFQRNLNKLKYICPVRTISMDGCPWSKYDNKDLWKHYDYRDFGIVGEPYFDFLNNAEINQSVTYFTDTARMWDGDKYNVRDKVTQKTQTDFRVHSTADFIRWLKNNPAPPMLMITTHPQRWTNNAMQWIMELIMQTLKNRVKRWLIHN